MNIGVENAYRSSMDVYSNSRQTRQINALRYMLGTDGGDKKDSVFISESAKSFSREQVVALVDSCANTSANQLTFYLENYNNPQGILDAINFGKGVSCGYNPDFKDFGVMNFEYDGSKQIVPIYAIPKMNANSLQEIRAIDNTLKLESKSYYSFTASNGRAYPWAVNEGHVGWARTESLLSFPDGGMQISAACRQEMCQVKGILSELARGESLSIYDNANILKTCEKIGIHPGFFSIDAGAGKHNYYLNESGKVFNLDEKIERLNKTNWIERGYSEGDKFCVFGNEYFIDASGYIQITEDDVFTTIDIVYPVKG